MTPLFANDRPGAYPESWYVASAVAPSPFPELKGQRQVDVCVVGGGYTGLSAALHLAERGYDVVLVEAHRVGFGASGRNGGQLGSGQRMAQDGLESFVGPEDAGKLWQLAEDAKGLVRDLVARHGIDCHLKPGIAHACFSAGEVRHEHAYGEHLRARYGYDQITPLDRDQMQALCPSPKYVGGSLDMGAGHLHPLAYALGLARAASAAGVRIFERTHVHDIVRGERVSVRTDQGRVEADHLILACNGYMGGLDRKVAARVMPINNFIAATEPLGDATARVLTRDVAVADSKFVVNYFRFSDDHRLLFGGTESYRYRFPRDIAGAVRQPLEEIFPQLKGVAITHGWGGTLGITMNRMPHFERVAGNILSLSGYSGHGVAMATLAGQIAAETIAGQAERFDVMASVPTPRFPGGVAMRWPLLVLAMLWFSLRDRL